MLNNWFKKEKPFAGFAGFGGGATGLGFGGGSSGLTDPLLFPLSLDASNNVYVHGVKTNGTYVGSALLSSGVGAYNCFFSNPYLCIFRSGSSSITRIDCTDFTSTTISVPSQRGWAPWDGEYTYISIRPSDYLLLDIESGTYSTVPYSGGGLTDIATTHQTLAFGTFGDTLFSSLSNEYRWTLGEFVGPSYPLYVYGATRSGSTLGTSSSKLNTGANYSRTWGMMGGDGSLGVIMRDGFAWYYLTPSGQTSFSISNISTGGYSWSANINRDSTDVSFNCMSNNKLYITQRRQISSYEYEFAVTNSPPLTSSTSSDTGIRIPNQTIDSGGNYQSPQMGTYMQQINEDGYIAVAQWDRSTYGDNTDILKIQVVDSSNNIVSTTSSSVGSSYTANNGSPGSKFGIIGGSFSTNLLYSGTKYN